MSRPAPATVNRWILEHPDATLREFREAFPGLPETTARRWLRSGAPVAETTGAAPQRVARTPAAELQPDDRAQVVSIVRGIYRALHCYAEAVEAQAASGNFNFDAAQARAARDLQRTAAGLVEAHPGLLELVKAGETEAADDDDLDDIVAALRGPAPNTPGAP